MQTFREKHKYFEVFQDLYFFNKEYFNAFYSFNYLMSSIHFLITYGDNLQEPSQQEYQEIQNHSTFKDRPHAFKVFTSLLNKIIQSNKSNSQAYTTRVQNKRYFVVNANLDTNIKLMNISTEIMYSFMLEENGDTIIQTLNPEDWDVNSISTEALKDLPFNNMKLPYPIFSIDARNWNHAFMNEYPIETIHVGKRKEGDEETLILIFSFVNQLEPLYYKFRTEYSLEHELSLQENKQVQRELLLILVKILNISMYLENFKKDSRRVIIKKNNSNKKKKAKKRTYNNKSVVYLTQPKTDDILELEAQEDSSNKREIMKSFYVRGHWRMQPYLNEDREPSLKKIWIDPFIKGKGKELLKKIIKV